MIFRGLEHFKGGILASLFVVGPFLGGGMFGGGGRNVDSNTPPSGTYTVTGTIASSAGYSTTSSVTDLFSGSAHRFRIFNQTGSVQLGEFHQTIGSAVSVGGQFDVSHIAGGSGTPTAATAGTGCGTSSSPSVTAGSDDMAGVLHVVCGSGGSTGNLIVSATWAHAYSSTPKCSWYPTTAATAAIMVSAQIIDGSSTSAVGVKCGGGTCPTATLDLGYRCSQ